MANDFRCKAVILHTVKYGDSGHIVYMYTDNFARQTYFVGGSRTGVPSVGKNKIKLQPLTIIDFIGYKSPRGEMFRIREVCASHFSPSILFDIRKSSIALLITEVIYRVLKESEPNPMLFDFITNSIYTLENMNDGVANFHLYFMVQLSRFLGFFPLIDYEQGTFFDIKRGQFVIIKPTHDNFIEARESELFHLLLKSPPEKLDDIKMNRSQRSYLLGKIVDFWGYHHDSAYKIASINILKEIF